MSEFVFLQESHDKTRRSAAEFQQTRSSLFWLSMKSEWEMRTISILPHVIAFSKNTALPCSMLCCMVCVLTANTMIRSNEGTRGISATWDWIHSRTKERQWVEELHTATIRAKGHTRSWMNNIACWWFDLHYWFRNESQYWERIRGSINFEKGCDEAIQVVSGRALHWSIPIVFLLIPRWRILKPCSRAFWR
jgi:hypothetical protein